MNLTDDTKKDIVQDFINAYDNFVELKQQNTDRSKNYKGNDTTNSDIKDLENSIKMLENGEKIQNLPPSVLKMLGLPEDLGSNIDYYNPVYEKYDKDISEIQHYYPYGKDSYFTPGSKHGKHLKVKRQVKDKDSGELVDVYENPDEEIVYHNDMKSGDAYPVDIFNDYPFPTDFQDENYKGHVADYIHADPKAEYYTVDTDKTLETEPVPAKVNIGNKEEVIKTLRQKIDDAKSKDSKSKNFQSSLNDFKQILNNNKELLEKKPNLIYNFFLQNMPNFKDFEPYLRNYFNENYFTENDDGKKSVSDDAKAFIKNLFTNIDNSFSAESDFVDKDFVKDIFNSYIKFLVNEKNWEDIQDNTSKDENIKRFRQYLRALQNDLSFVQAPQDLYRHLKNLPFFEDFEPYLRNYFKNNPNISDNSKQLSEAMFSFHDQDKNAKARPFSETLNQNTEQIRKEVDYEDKPLDLRNISIMKDDITKSLNNLSLNYNDLSELDNSINTIEAYFNNLGINGDYYKSYLDTFKSNLKKLLVSGASQESLKAQFSEFIDDTISKYLTRESSNYYKKRSSDTEPINTQFTKAKDSLESFYESILDDDPVFYNSFKMNYNNIHSILRYFKDYLYKYLSLETMLEIGGNRSKETIDNKFLNILNNINNINGRLNYIKRYKDPESDKVIKIDEKFKEAFIKDLGTLFNDLDKVSEFIENHKVIEN